MRVKVKELIAKLKKFNGDSDVVCCWDGGFSNPDTIIVEDGIVVIDVEKYGTYRHDD